MIDPGKRYEQVPHTADLAVKVYGDDMAGLFTNSAHAMFDLMAEHAGTRAEMPYPRSEGQVEVKVNAEGGDTESLLINWLNELLYLSFEKKIIFNRFEVLSVDDKSVRSMAYGEAASPAKHRIKHEIKAATFHDLHIKKTDSGYEVVIVFDI